MSAKQSKRDRQIASGQHPNHTQVTAQFNHLSYTPNILPDAAQLARIEALYPGATEEIVTVWKAQVIHRQELEKFTIAGDAHRADRGQVMAFILGIIGLVGGFGCVLAGKSIEGVSAIVLSVATLLTAFYAGTKSKNADLNKKKQKLDSRR